MFEIIMKLYSSNNYISLITMVHLCSYNTCLILNKLSWISVCLESKEPQRVFNVWIVTNLPTTTLPRSIQNESLCPLFARHCFLGDMKQDWAIARGLLCHNAPCTEP